MAQSLDNAEEKKPQPKAPWNEFLELTKDWPRIKIGSGDAPHEVPFSAAHLYKNSPFWRKSMEGGGDLPKELLTQNRINPATDLEFQRIWMYLNGFGPFPEDLSETGEQYLGYFGEDAGFAALPLKIREALKPLKKVIKDRHEVFSGEEEALKVIVRYTQALQTKCKNDLKLRTNQRPEAAKRMLQDAGFHIELDSTDPNYWYIQYQPRGSKRARKM